MLDVFGSMFESWFALAEIGGADNLGKSVFSVTEVGPKLLRSWLTRLFNTVFLTLLESDSSTECKNSGGSFQPRSLFPIFQVNNSRLK